jgi:hypothetical protein
MSTLKMLSDKIYQWIIALRLRYLVSKIRDRMQSLSNMTSPVKG